MNEIDLFKSLPISILVPMLLDSSANSYVKHIEGFMTFILFNETKTICWTFFKLDRQ